MASKILGENSVIIDVEAAIQRIEQYYASNKSRANETLAFFALARIMDDKEHRELLGKSTYQRHKKQLKDAGITNVEKEEVSETDKFISSFRFDIFGQYAETYEKTCDYLSQERAIIERIAKASK